MYYFEQQKSIEIVLVPYMGWGRAWSRGRKAACRPQQRGWCEYQKASKLVSFFKGPGTSIPFRLYHGMAHVKAIAVRTTVTIPRHALRSLHKPPVVRGLLLAEAGASWAHTPQGSCAGSSGSDLSSARLHASQPWQSYTCRDHLQLFTYKEYDTRPRFSLRSQQWRLFWATKVREVRKV